MVDYYHHPIALLNNTDFFSFHCTLQVINKTNGNLPNHYLICILVRFVKPQKCFVEDIECSTFPLYVLLKYCTKKSVQARTAYTKGQLSRYYTNKTTHILLLSYVNIIVEATFQRFVELF